MHDGRQSGAGPTPLAASLSDDAAPGGALADGDVKCVIGEVPDEVEATQHRSGTAQGAPEPLVVVDEVHRRVFPEDLGDGECLAGESAGTDEEEVGHRRLPALRNASTTRDCSDSDIWWNNGRISVLSVSRSVTGSGFTRAGPRVRAGGALP